MLLIIAACFWWGALGADRAFLLTSSGRNGAQYSWRSLDVHTGNVSLVSSWGAGIQPSRLSNGNAAMVDKQGQVWIFTVNGSSSPSVLGLSRFSHSLQEHSFIPRSIPRTVLWSAYDPVSDSFATVIPADGRYTNGIFGYVSKAGVWKAVGECNWNGVLYQSSANAFIINRTMYFWLSLPGGGSQRTFFLGAVRLSDGSFTRTKLQFTSYGFGIENAFFEYQGMLYAIVKAYNDQTMRIDVCTGICKWIGPGWDNVQNGMNYVRMQQSTGTAYAIGRPYQRPRNLAAWSLPQNATLPTIPLLIDPTQVKIQAMVFL